MYRITALVWGLLFILPLPVTAQTFKAEPAGSPPPPPSTAKATAEPAHKPEMLKVGLKKEGPNVILSVTPSPERVDLFSGRKKLGKLSRSKKGRYDVTEYVLKVADNKLAVDAYNNTGNKFSKTFDVGKYKAALQPDFPKAKKTSTSGDTAAVAQSQAPGAEKTAKFKGTIAPFPSSPAKLQIERVYLKGGHIHVDFTKTGSEKISNDVYRHSWVMLKSGVRQYRWPLSRVAPLSALNSQRRPFVFNTRQVVKKGETVDVRLSGPGQKSQARDRQTSALMTQGTTPPDLPPPRPGPGDLPPTSPESEHWEGEVHIPASDLPDLQIIDMGLDQYCNIYVKIRNNGPGQLPESAWADEGDKVADVYLHVNGQGWGGRTLRGIDGNRALRNHYGIVTYGSNKNIPFQADVEAFVDSQNAIFESDEHNNSAYETLVCPYRPLPDLTIVEFRELGQNDDNDIGDRVEIRTRVKNIGAMDATHFELLVHCHKNKDRVHRLVVPAGDEVAILDSFRWANHGFKECRANIVKTAAKPNLAYEINPQNNSAGPISVKIILRGQFDQGGVD